MNTMSAHRHRSMTCTTIVSFTEDEWWADRMTAHASFLLRCGLVTLKLKQVSSTVQSPRRGRVIRVIGRPCSVWGSLALNTFTVSIYVLFLCFFVDVFAYENYSVLYPTSNLPEFAGICQELPKIICFKKGNRSTQKNCIFFAPLLKC